MKDYLFIFRGGLDVDNATTEQFQQAMARWKAWMEQLAAAGHYIDGQRLSSKNGAVLSGENVRITDGPFTEGKEIVGGFLAIKADDRAQAIELAKGCPILVYNGSCEVREIAPREATAGIAGRA